MSGADPDTDKLAVGWSRWEAFEGQVRSQNRYAPQGQHLAERLVEEALRHFRERDERDRFFRARIMPLGYQKVKGPYKPGPDVGAPTANRATGGRLNPPGIPYLYLATSMGTAIDEVRPWPDALVTVATFKLRKKCTLVVLDDFVRDTDEPALAFLPHALARPADRRDPLAYVASQYIAEQIKARGVDGIEYPSSFRPSEERNVALFDPHVGEAVATQLWTVDSVRVEFHEVLAPASATEPPPPRGHAGSENPPLPD